MSLDVFSSLFGSKFKVLFLKAKTLYGKFSSGDFFFLKEVLNLRMLLLFV